MRLASFDLVWQLLGGEETSSSRVPLLALIMIALLSVHPRQNSRHCIISNTGHKGLYPTMALTAAATL